MRKHVKTVHGADFYASKKHKGVGDGSDGGGRRSNKEADRGFREAETGCHPLTPLTPNSNASGSPKIKSEVLR